MSEVPQVGRALVAETLLSIRSVNSGLVLSCEHVGLHAPRAECHVVGCTLAWRIHAPTLGPCYPRGTLDRLGISVVVMSPHRHAQQLVA